MSADGEAITPEGLDALKAELAELEGPRRRDMSQRIQRARELGDLSENAEYHTAKEDQGHMETRILQLQERLRRAVVTKASTSTNTVAFGATVHVHDEDKGREASYTIVGPTEADAAAGKLSAESPVAQALLGRGAGETVSLETPRGTRKLRIERIGA